MLRVPTFVRGVSDGRTELRCVRHSMVLVARELCGGNTSDEANVDNVETRTAASTPDR